VLIVILLASMLAVSLLFRMKAEETAAVAGHGSEQAWAAAMTGVQEAMRVARAAPPGSWEWRDDPAAFRQRFVCDDGADRWYFTVYSAGDPDLGDIRYGLTDEASKLNLNAAPETMIARLPKFTPPLAQALLDFLDADSTPRPDGAEQEYYDALPKPYALRNGPLSTVDELLLVRGFAPSLLHGEDANLNFLLESNEDDSDQTFPPDNSDGKLDLGLRPYVTVSSYDQNVDRDGFPRLNINDPDDLLRTNDLPAELVLYLAALRDAKAQLAHPADLLEAKLTIKDERGQAVQLPSGVGPEELPVVLDVLTTTVDETLPGLINVNTAPAPVLQTLPDVDEPLAEAIVSARRNVTLEKRCTPAWLLAEGVVNVALFKKLAPHVTSRSLQFSFHAVGYSIPSGRYRVLDVVIDVSGTTPSVIYLRDLTRLGLPFRIETEAATQVAGR
jgi:DNA uptake protein ComE-like DNA-binding protein